MSNNKTEKLTWRTEQRRPNDLIPLSINPRKITEEKRQKLIESLEKFNLVEIPAINADNTIIAGHQRIISLQIVGRGNELIDIRVPNRLLTEKEIKEYNLLSNTHAGEFDFDLIEAHFSDIDMAEIGIEITPPDTTDIPVKKEVYKEEDDIEDLQNYVTKINTDIQPGDLFQIGPHRLLCGDSTQTDTFGRLFGQELADLVITDPPYNIDYTGKTKNALKIKNDSMSKNAFYQFLYNFYTALGSYTRPGGGGMYGMQIQKEQILGKP